MQTSQCYNGKLSPVCWRAKYFVPTSQHSADGVQVYRIKKYPLYLKPIMFKYAKELGLSHLNSALGQEHMMISHENGELMSTMNEAELKATLDLV